MKHVRYPAKGGYARFGRLFAQGARVKTGHEVVQIDLNQRTLWFRGGETHRYERLINTMPLPEFIGLTRHVPGQVREAADVLCCTSLVLVNVAAAAPANHSFHWFYVYDDDKLSTRVNHVDRLSPANAPEGVTGVQVEVYGSRHRPFPADERTVARKVTAELVEMGVVKTVLGVHTHRVPYANVVFDRERRAAQDEILGWLKQFGLRREADDLEPTTDWDHAERTTPGALTLAGRFGQWKYFWTDDCVLRGRQLGVSDD